MDPQHGIFVEGNRHHWFLEFAISDPTGVGAALGSVAAAAQGSTPADTVQMVVGLGPRLAAELLGDALPDGLRPYQTISGAERLAPSTQGDLWVWLHSDHHDKNFDPALAARRGLGPLGELLDEVAGWVYHDSRDLTGFIDGTENPSAPEARELVLISEGPAAGGTLAFTQRWIHNLDGFHALDQAAQEAVIGRTKPDSVELDPLPDTSHVGRVVIEDDEGEELEIYRRSVPYGSAKEAGLYFLAFTDDLGLIDAMLNRMVGNDGPPDRVTDFSEAVTGSFWFVPSGDQVRSLLG